MIERMAENDKIVTRQHGGSRFPAIGVSILAKEIFNAVRDNALQMPEKTAPVT
ncbi:MAG: hypothetical protein U1F68_13155 [Gammaproteobacteria bacterium]